MATSNQSPLDPSKTSGDPQTSSPAELLRRFAADFDRQFEGFLTVDGQVPAKLLEAVRYSALAPGKRVRPYLVVRCCELAGGARDDAWAPAAAVECVHAFSLIHDDLPAMDDDDLRRGRPTCHKQFGEALAILAGDALVTLAFELLATEKPDPAVSVRMTRELARATGWAGMIGGQAADILTTNAAPDRDLIHAIHLRKTARLFACACRLGAIAGKAPPPQIDGLGRFGEKLGLAFQIADDLLDVEGESKPPPTGPPKRVELSLPRAIGLEASREAAESAVNAALQELDACGPAAEDLRRLTRFVVDRNY